MSNVDSNNIKNKLVDLYHQNAEIVSSGLPDSVNEHRATAIENFSLWGIPKKGSEAYKYTDLMRVFGKTYGYTFKSPQDKVNLESVFKCTVPDLDTYTILLENGWFYQKNIDGIKLPKGLIIKSFREATTEFPELFKEYYNKQAKNAKSSTTELNTAFAQDGLFVYIQDNTVLKKPIQIINLLRGNNPLLINQRNLIIAGKNSQAKFIVCDHTLSNQSFLSNSVTEIFIDDDAIFDIYSIQNQHNLSSQIASIFVHQNKNTNSLINTLTLHGGFVRNNVSVTLAEEYSEANLYGLSIVDSKQHVDNQTFVDHAEPNCNSNELYKNILDEEATAAFNGRILVQENAQKTQAFQSNKNICLTPQAKMYTKPQLEIYADDVKCSHGATIGQIDEEAFFYLKSRGIGANQARMMLMYAFAHEVISNIRVPKLAERYTMLVQKRLSREPSKCAECSYKG